MAYASQTETIDRLIGIRSTLAGDDKSDAVKNPEYLAAAWDVVVEHEALIHFVLSKKRITKDMPSYEDAVSYLTQALFDCCWTYNPYATNAAKFSSFVIQSISLKLLRFFELEKRKHMPYYVPVNVTPEWVEEKARSIQKELKEKLNSSTEILYDVNRRKKLRDAANKKMTPVLSAQWSMNAKPMHAKRFTVGEAGEYQEIETDPIELIPDNPEHTTPESNPVLDEVIGDSAYQDVKKVMDERLSYRDNMVLSLYFGLEGNDPHTYAAIGDTLGLTSGRVQQIATRALRRLRYAIAS